MYAQLTTTIARFDSAALVTAFESRANNGTRRTSDIVAAKRGLDTGLVSKWVGGKR